MSMTLFVAIIVLALIVIGFLALQAFEGQTDQSVTEEGESEPQVDLSMYEKKRFLFDTTPEFNLFKMLVELFGQDYHVFPEINYSHLISVTGPKHKQRAYRSKIDRKSADFVLCDKTTAVPVLVIELDGSVHGLKAKQSRDVFVDQLLKHVGLPVLHLKSGKIDKGFVRSEVNKKLPAV